MRIAFVSYEYPPDTGIGGIATYVRQIARMFASNSIDVEVICGSNSRTMSEMEKPYLLVHRIQCKTRESFTKLSPQKLKERHVFKKFNLVEVPEFGAEGLYIKKFLPQVSLIVKLHTPSFIVKQWNDFYFNQRPIRQVKHALGLGYNFNNDREYKSTNIADFILSPSLSLKEIVSQKWHIHSDRILHIPNLYIPSEILLQIPVDSESNTVLYIGRLETRKGVWNLSKTVAGVVRNIPNAKFIFLGKDSIGPNRESSMKAIMEKEMSGVMQNVEFLDQVTPEEIPGYISKSDVCIFPSLWENFPNVCLEAMAGARGIIASKNGGMKDMLEDVNGGLLINPLEPVEIEEAMIDLLMNDKKRKGMGERNRGKIVEYYNKKLIRELLSTYASFIK